MRLWLVAITLCGLAAGQSTGRIEGRVVSQSGEPIRKATVRLQVMGSAPVQGQLASYVEVSDSAGRFSVEGLAPGRYQVTASRVGYTALRNNNTQPDPTITLQAGQAKTDVEIKMVPLGIISGQISDQDGDPVVGAQVQALRIQYNGSRRQLVGFGSAQSDDQGNFRMLNIPPGRYYVLGDDQAARSNLGTQERRGRSAQEVNVVTLYPGAADFGGAVGVDVGAGSELRGVNIRMNRARLFSIRGKAVDSRTGAPSSVQLSMRTKGGLTGMPGSQFNASAPMATGAFAFYGVQSGTYVVQATPRPNQANAPASGIPNLAGSMEVRVANSDVDGVTFTLSPPLEITGTVRAESGDLRTVFPPVGTAAVGPANGPGDTAAAARANLAVAAARATISLTIADDNAGATPNAQVEADGTFKLQNAGWSRYTVALRPLAPGVYIKSIRFGGQDALKSPIDLTSGAGGVLEILLSPKAGEVDATVHGKNGEVVTGVAVTMWPKTPMAVDPLSGRVVRSGDQAARITSVPPGEYYVAAWEDVDLSILGYPEFLARFTDVATSVKVGESDKVAADLTLIPKDKIAVEVAKLP